MDMPADPPANVEPALWNYLINLNEHVRESDNRISVLENENAKKSAQITLLNTKISLYEKRLSQTRSANTDLTTRSMNQNIVFSCNEKQLSTAEGQEDDCVSIVKDLIQNKLKTTGIQVVRAHRLGSSNASRSAPIVARLASREQVAAVLKNGKELESMLTHSYRQKLGNDVSLLMRSSKQRVINQALQLVWQVINSI